MYIEILCAVLAVTGVNQDLCDGRSKKERLAHMNTDYKFQVETMVDTKKWVDQFGVPEDKITPDHAETILPFIPLSTVSFHVFQVTGT